MNRTSGLHLAEGASDLLDWRNRQGAKSGSTYGGKESFDKECHRVKVCENDHLAWITGAVVVERKRSPEEPGPEGLEKVELLGWTSKCRASWELPHEGDQVPESPRFAAATCRMGFDGLQ